jgi:hypothetical protein
MIGIHYPLASEGGKVQPGDDMHDAQYRWWAIAELTAANIRFHPSTHVWILQRAVMRYRCWKDQPAVPLQPDLAP